MSNKTFETTETAQEAVAKLESSWAYHKAEISLEKVRKYSKPGRPKPGTSPDKIVYKINSEVIRDEDKINHSKKFHGRFILATSELDASKLTAAEVLNLYKSQSVSVERGFRFLKDPMFFASSLYLKKPQRIMALIMIMGLSLLVYSLAERKLRLILQERDETLPNQLGKEVANPTLRWIFQMFQGIHVLLVKELSQTLILNLKPIHLRIASLFGPEVENQYLTNS